MNYKEIRLALRELRDVVKISELNYKRLIVSETPYGLFWQGEEYSTESEIKELVLEYYAAVTKARSEYARTKSI